MRNNEEGEIIYLLFNAERTDNPLRELLALITTVQIIY